MEKGLTEESFTLQECGQPGIVASRWGGKLGNRQQCWPKLSLKRLEGLVRTWGDIPESKAQAQPEGVREHSG